MLKVICFLHLRHKLLRWKTPLNKCVCITFHAVLDTESWGWDDQSAMYMRFENEVMGEWKLECGPAGVKRYVVYVNIVIPFLKVLDLTTKWPWWNAD